ncbi:MAG: nitrate ABC transporter ATP-binding protein [Microcoleaceae cyanobacterium]
MQQEPKKVMQTLPTENSQTDKQTAVRQKENYVVIDNVCKIYETARGPYTVLENVNLSVKDGEFICLIGHSGCGKSTLLNMVSGFNQPTTGEVRVNGVKVTEPGPERMMVFQNYSLLPWLTAEQNILLGVDSVYPDKTVEERRQIVQDHLSLVGLTEASTKKPLQLSGGMRQRVAIARALATRPDVLILDEPFGALDPITKEELQEELLKIWRDHQITALMITHDIDEALFLADRLVMMTNGPNAQIGEILDIPFGRPRNRSKIMEDPRYYELRNYALDFLFRRFAHDEVGESDKISTNDTEDNSVDVPALLASYNLTNEKSVSKEINPMSLPENKPSGKIDYPEVSHYNNEELSPQVRNLSVIGLVAVLLGVAISAVMAGSNNRIDKKETTTTSVSPSPIETVVVEVSPMTSPITSPIPTASVAVEVSPMASPSTATSPEASPMLSPSPIITEASPMVSPSTAISPEASPMISPSPITTEASAKASPSNAISPEVSPATGNASPDSTTAVSPSPAPIATTPDNMANNNNTNPPKTNSMTTTVDSAKVQELNDLLYQQLDANWRSPVTADAKYLVKVNDIGEVVAFEAANEDGKSNVTNVPLPNIVVNAGNVSPVAEFDVTFGANNELIVKPRQ